MKQLIFLIVVYLLIVSFSKKEKEHPSTDFVKRGQCAGVSVGVFQDGKPLILKGYISADLGIKLSASASFEID